MNLWAKLISAKHHLEGRFNLLFMLRFTLFAKQGPVAQLDRASVCGTEGRRFDSCRVHQKERLILGWGFLFGFLLGEACECIDRRSNNNRTEYIREQCVLEGCFSEFFGHKVSVRYLKGHP